ncbi:AAA family ATPase [Corynebacterium simulans]|uniref:AAA family ATPase n=1 Tax=Corynebacterium simulans TaxID=146827 RepID=UPI00200568AF|nr:AAA family ATPase [Corynebacterium simulans]MCK6161403.1 AAA family ATPase [Corynebacterium simulans]
MPEYTTARPSFERVLNAVEDAGLHVTYRNDTQASFQTPGHSAKDRGTSVTYNGKQTLIYCHNGDTDDVLNALGLTVRDLFDEENGARYDYGDGRIVCRDPKKVFKQLGNTKGTNLYGLGTLENEGPVYVVEGEKDADTAAHVWHAAAVTQAQGASTSPERASWEPLADREVVIIADNDAPGRKRADKVFTYLTGMSPRPKSIIIKTAKEGKDLSDHIAAGHTADELVDQGAKIGRRRVKLTPATSIKTETIDWVIDQWIPAGMLTLLAGREGIGKSTIACDWVSMLSKKGVKCAYLNSEDSRSYTVKPRLQAAGANLDNVFFIDVETETGNEGHLTLPQDTNLLFDELDDQGVKFVVLDAAKSSMDPKLDGYKDDHVRQFLEPLSAAADKYGITVVGLAHFGKAEGKDTGKLLLGSIAWSQIARSVLSAAKDDDGRLIVSNTKANLARGIVSREAHLVSRPVKLSDGTLTELGAIEWGEFTDTVATELLDRQEMDASGRSEIEAVVLDYLASNGGSAPAKEVLKATRAAGLDDNAVKKARGKIGVETKKAGMSGGWVWAIKPGKPFSKVPEDSEDSRAQTQESSESSRESSETKPRLKTHEEHEGAQQTFQLDHPQESEPTERISRLEPRSGRVTNETRTAVIGSLATSAGMSPSVVKASLTQDQIAEIGDLDNYLKTLVVDGLIAQDDKGRYLKLKETA